MKVYVGVSFSTNDDNTAVCGVSRTPYGAKQAVSSFRNEALVFSKDGGGMLLEDKAGDLVGSVREFLLNEDIQ